MSQHAPESFLNDLSNLLARGQILAVVGAGVSIGATKNASTASWPGLLEHGIRRCEDVADPPVNRRWVERNLEILSDKHVDTDELISVAGQIEAKLRAPDGPEFRRWLRESIGVLEVRDDRVLHALARLNVPIATTNYDGLIESALHLEPLTWRDGPNLVRAVRNDDHGGVLHLHGYWNRPDTIVLGPRSYERMIGDELAQHLMHLLSTIDSFLFVGCGGGLEDPNFEQLRRWLQQVLGRSEHRHYQLAMDSQVAAIRRRDSNDRIYVLPYGPGPDALPEFLSSLCDRSLSSTHSPAPPPQVESSSVASMIRGLTSNGEFVTAMTKARQALTGKPSVALLAAFMEACDRGSRPEFAFPIIPNALEKLGASDPWGVDMESHYRHGRLLAQAGAYTDALECHCANVPLKGLHRYIVQETPVVPEFQDSLLEDLNQQLKSQSLDYWQARSLYEIANIVCMLEDFAKGRKLFGLLEPLVLEGRRTESDFGADTCKWLASVYALRVAYDRLGIEPFRNTWPQDDPDTSLIFAHQAITFAEGIDFADGEAWGYTALSYGFEAQGSWDDARNASDKACRRLENPRVRASTRPYIYLYRAGLERRAGVLEDAKRWIEEASRAVPLSRRYALRGRIEEERALVASSHGDSVNFFRHLATSLHRNSLWRATLVAPEGGELHWPILDRIQLLEHWLKNKERLAVDGESRK